METSHQRLDTESVSDAFGSSLTAEWQPRAANKGEGRDTFHQEAISQYPFLENITVQGVAKPGTFLYSNNPKSPPKLKHLLLS